MLLRARQGKPQEAVALAKKPAYGDAGYLWRLSLIIGIMASGNTVAKEKALPECSKEDFVKLIVDMVQRLKRSETLKSMLSFAFNKG